MQASELQALEQQLIRHFFNQNYALIESELPVILESEPDWLNGWKILSDTLLIQGKDAKPAAAQALRLNQQDAQEHCYYGLVLKRDGDLAGAKKAFETAIQLAPNHVAALNNLGIVEKDAGNIDVGIGYFRQALKRMPDYAECHSNLLLCLSHTQTDPKALLKAHQAYARQFETPYLKQWPVHQKNNKPERVLKVGFVSADFRDHSIAYCFEPLLTALAQDKGLALYAYYNQTIVDETTQRIQQKFAHWHQVSELSDTALHKRIRQDDIDVLIDLSGHTADNRLPVFARKPAPIQISWFGYLATTGLKAMDYYFCDPYLAPPALLDQSFTERLVQLPVNALFKPATKAPEVNTLPALVNGYLTFGSFHRASKVSQATIARWASLLKTLPTAKLLMGGVSDKTSEAHFKTAFIQEGVHPGRINFAPRADLQTYLAMHHQVDLALDTYPSSGITPALHAAWMGVPTLCESTETLTGRGAMAVMSHLGIKSVVGQDWEAVIANAVYFDSNPALLADLRQSLRTQFEASALMNAPKQAHAFSTALREMWQRWLKRKANRSFTVTDIH